MRGVSWSGPRGASGEAGGLRAEAGGEQARARRVEARDGGGVGVAAGEVGGADEQDLVADVVHGDDLVEEHEVRVGHAELVGGEGGQALDEADDVVGEEADGAGGEGGQAGEAGGGVAGERGLERVEDVGLLRVGVGLLGDGDFRPRAVMVL